MHVIHVRNVCQALPEGLEYLLREGVREQSRAGSVIVAPGPVTTVYERPGERVLFSEVRDANPFFHLYEAIWMLAGRRESASLTRYVRNFSQFAEDDGEIHGAYGHRWRTAFGYDQLDHVVETLRRDPSSRQCVIQMWDGRDECIELVGGETIDQTGQNDLRGSWRDRPCNTHVYLRVRKVVVDQNWNSSTADPLTNSVLDMQVCCRSNDMILGGYGANAVHFSVLLEYLAARIGVGVGRYYQTSWNYHVYESEIERLRKRHEACGSHHSLEKELLADRYSTPRAPGGSLVEPEPMFSYPKEVDEDVRRFCAWHDLDDHGSFDAIENYWFQTTAWRAARAHKYFRERDFVLALQMANNIEAEDWRIACTEWIQRRKK